MWLGKNGFSFFNVCFSILLRMFLLNTVTSHRPRLTCSETLKAPLIPLSMYCVDLSSENYIYNCTTFHQSQKNMKWIISTQLVVQLGNHGADEPYLDTDNCVGMNVWIGKSIDAASHFTINLSPSKIIGTVTPRCGDAGRHNCSFEVKLRADVLALPPFSFTLDEPLFWNFSSPLFRADVGWLYCLGATAAVEDHSSFELPGLAGTSIDCLALNGTFGTDTKGPLPHMNHLPLIDNILIKNSAMVDLLPGCFNGSESLQSLVIRGSIFRKIPPEIVVLKKLRLFSFESTVPNFTFDPKILSGFSILWTLSLSGTRIEHWRGNNIPKLPKLSILNLKSCQMKTFTASTSDLPVLNFLNLKDNMLSFLAPDAFAGLPTLKGIFLNKNFLYYLPPQLFLGLPRLKIINLQSNNLISWPRLPSNIYWNVSLSENNISNIINLGCEILRIKKLDISFTNLAQWHDPNVFRTDKCRNLTFLKIKLSSKDPKSPIVNGTQLSPAWALNVNISNNNIAVFSEPMLQSLDTLKEVDLGGNIIDCGNCKTSRLQHWLGITTTVVKNLGQSTRLTCFQPAHMKGQFVQEVDFDAMCFTPRRRLWLGMGLSLVGIAALVALGGGLAFYYRTEFAYLVHLAKVRSTSKKWKKDNQGVCCYDAFVCYSGKNRKWVMRRVIPLLEHGPESYVLCLFDRDFRLGSHIVTNIVDAIHKSRKVIIILTRHFIDSKWCQWELEMAQHKLFSEDREFLVLLELEPLERRRLPRLLRFLLDTRPVVRWPRPETAPAVLAAAAQLHRALGPSLRQRPPPEDEPGPFAFPPQQWGEEGEAAPGGSSAFSDGGEHELLLERSADEE